MANVSGIWLIRYQKAIALAGTADQGTSRHVARRFSDNVHQALGTLK